MAVCFHSRPAHGYCELGECVCEAGYSGTRCQFTNCSGWSCSIFLSTCAGKPVPLRILGCSGHGRCYGPDHCICNSSWSGPTCSTPACTPGNSFFLGNSCFFLDKTYPKLNPQLNKTAPSDPQPAARVVTALRPVPATACLAGPAPPVVFLTAQVLSTD